MEGPQQNRPFSRVQHLIDFYKSPGMSLIWLMLGEAFTFVIHISNLVFLEVLRWNEPIRVTNDPRTKLFRGQIYHYFTSWTVCMQILNSIFGFCCDAALFYYKDDRKYKLPEEYRFMRDVMFDGVIWPCTMMLSTGFWSLYLYDRSLIYPEFMDQIIGPASNHILHTLIVPIVLWEVVFRKREKPESHARNLWQMTIHMSIYMTLFYYAYFIDGIWLYPIFEKTHGKIDFVFLHLAIAAMLVFFYYLQWVLNYLIHGKQEKTKAK